MEDDHVDRPGVEAQQCAKLTGTNSSIGLIVPIACTRREAAQEKYQLLENEHVRFADLVVMAGCLHPIPFRTRP